MTDKTPTQPTVFISYSHKDEAWKDRFIPQLRALEQAGRIVVWDDRKIDGGEKWYPEIKRAMEEAGVAVCIISPDYLASGFCVKEEVPFLLQRCERDGMVFIPLLLRPCPWKAFEWLKEIQMLPRDGKNVVVDFRGIEDSVFADVANLILEIVDNPSKYNLPPSPAPLWSPPEKIDIDRLPVTGGELFGRQKELEMLDAAWASDSTHIVSLVAWGGVGKSTLVNKWVERMQADNYRGARRVYGWSFYSQGTGERVTSADQFINHALTWFGDPDPTAGSPWDKGERLARLVQSEKTLLLLDGLEPLQSSHAHERGKIKDPALVMLLTELGQHNPGLCLITTREQVIDLAEFETNAQHQDLEQISDEAGRALLRVGGVQGTDAELEQATRDFGNHALAINLLAVYLRDVPGHHVSHSAAIHDLDIPAEAGKHPRRVMAAFARRFGDGPEVELLRMLGLFERPADGESLTALRAAPPIPALTDHLHSLSEADWLRLIEKLRRMKLIALAGHHDDTDLDAHPLVREHFGQQLKQHHSAAWREGNSRLYEHLKNTVEMFPSTVKARIPLYDAVSHGCEAGKHQLAFDEVYSLRLLKGDNRVNLANFGTFGYDLLALSNFFEPFWSKPIEHLREDTKFDVIDLAGLCLWALGKLDEAEQLFNEACSEFVVKGNFNQAARIMNNVSAVNRMRGNLKQASVSARQAIVFAESNLDTKTYAFRLVSAKVTLADALYQAGKNVEAKRLFEDAEELHQEKQKHEIPFLYGREGYQYSDFLLDQGEYRTVLQRVTLTLKRAKNFKRNRHIALDRLSLGRAYLIQAQRENLSAVDRAVSYLEQAVGSLREIGMAHHLPAGLLVAGELHRFLGELGKARSYLEEATRVSTRANLGLYKADCYLEYARLYLAMSENENEPKAKQVNREKAREHWDTAKEMIARMGYHRRDKDVKEIDDQLSL